ncbi:hypothetical protein [Halothermothrix orenii]|uniref:Uncharacterized protein n=1 Tax=Halothermothrix orenii (strain H 168 / OCM 544 / DSM 9562) TaxID=373903 RepID=B8D1W7_HALOH|nr:hypothetical protein [Halothermothrix orenii]ACL69194.1 hypothetical protein Hore_04360 [Halothermothrix orenii H 168]
MILEITNYLTRYEKYEPVNQHIDKRLVNTFSIILPIVLFIILKKLNLVLSFNAILLYLYVNIFVRVNTLALRVISKKYGGIYENLLATGMGRKHLIIIETLIYIKQNWVKIILFNSSITLGYYLINLKLMSVYNLLVFLLIANIISIILHLIVGAITVINGMVNNSLAQLITLIGWGSGLVLFLSKHIIIKITVPLVVICLLGGYSVINILIKEDYEVI